jgi:hypothetical protein
VFCTTWSCIRLSLTQRTSTRRRDAPQIEGATSEPQRDNERRESNGACAQMCVTAASCRRVHPLILTSLRHCPCALGVCKAEHMESISDTSCGDVVHALVTASSMRCSQRVAMIVCMFSPPMDGICTLLDERERSSRRREGDAPTAALSIRSLIEPISDMSSVVRLLDPIGPDESASFNSLVLSDSQPASNRVVTEGQPCLTFRSAAFVS